MDWKMIPMISKVVVVVAVVHRKKPFRDVGAVVLVETRQRMTIHVEFAAFGQDRVTGEFADGYSCHAVPKCSLGHVVVDVDVTLDVCLDCTEGVVESLGAKVLVWAEDEEEEAPRPLAFPLEFDWTTCPPSRSDSHFSLQCLLSRHHRHGQVVQV